MSSSSVSSYYYKPQDYVEKVRPGVPYKVQEEDPNKVSVGRLEAYGDTRFGNPYKMDKVILRGDGS